MWMTTLDLLFDALWETILMVAASGTIAAILGVPLGVVLVVTSKGHVLERPGLNRAIGAVVNMTRSVPFIILLVALIPVTRAIVGTWIGTAATIVPLTIAAVPFVARLVEPVMLEVDRGLIEAAHAMGAAPLQIVFKVLLPEARPGIAAALTNMIVNLIGYSAMAGAVGGGGLGDLAIRYGHQRYDQTIMLLVVIVLIVLVQGVQSVGDWVVRKVNKKIVS